MTNSKVRNRFRYLTVTHVFIMKLKVGCTCKMCGVITSELFYLLVF
jgi:hypothetical protein